VEPGPCAGHKSSPAGRSSESYNYSSSHYDESDALRFKAERDESQRELGEVSKKSGITELEWEHQRRQLLETIDGKSLD
jgi:hypothetical protein